MNGLSICVVSYNNAENTKALIDSIIASTKKTDYHIYVVDNYEPEYTTKKALRGLYPEDKVTFLTSENNGFGAGHNSVLPLIDSEYHAVVNPDITVDSEVFAELTGYLERHPETALVTPMIKNPDGTEQFLPRRTPTLKYLVLGRLSGKIPALRKYRDEYTMKNEDFSSPVEIQFCTGCFMVMRTADFRRISGFDDGYFMYFEDVDLTERMKVCGNAMLIHDSAVTHDWAGGSRKSKKLMSYHIRSMFRYFLRRGKIRRQTEKELAK